MGKTEDFFKLQEDLPLKNASELDQLKKAKTFNVKKIIIIAAIFVVISGLSSTSFYFYRQYKKASVVQPTQDTRDEVTKLTDEIKTFMYLPDEIPTLATVTNAEQAKSQPFFIKALNGDKVLIYVKAKKAILYRPTEKRIIEVANVSGLGEEQNNAAPIQSENAGNEQNSISGAETLEAVKPKIVKVAVYNGSKIKGLASKLAEKIERIEDIGDIEITEKTNAKGFYDVTFVADLKGGNMSICEKIAQAIGGQVGVFPEGEAMPDADILVIGGAL